MAVITLLPTALRGTTHTTLDVPANPPGHVKLALTSPTFGADPTLSFHMVVLQSFDGGATFTPVDENGQPMTYVDMQGTGGFAGKLNKDGSVFDGLPWIIWQYDGLARFLDITMTVPTPFSWGLTAEVLLF